MEESYRDVVVIGGGTAGLAAERAARQAGATTMLIDPAFAGTTCATVGCMPSKLLIAAGHAAQAVQDAGAFGVHISSRHIDGRAVFRRVHQMRDEFAQSARDEVGKLPAGIAVQSVAHFTGRNAVTLKNGDVVAYRAAVIATGAEPSLPDPFRHLGAAVLTNESVFELDDLPQSLAVIGAGPLGLELAQAFARLGVKVTVFSDGPEIAGLKDYAVTRVLARLLMQEMTLVLNVEIEPSEASFGIKLRWSGDTQGSATFDRVLVATGRSPRLGGLRPEAAGLVVDEAGVPVFDKATLQCGTSPVFLAGDANDDRPVLHEASAEGTIAGTNAASFPEHKPAPRHVPFTLTFLDPPLAVVGDVSSEGDLIGESDYASQGRARIENQAKGLVRIHAERERGKIRGATLLGPGMDHMGHLMAWAIERGETASGLLKLPFYHPTLEEGLRGALEQVR